MEEKARQGAPWLPQLQGQMRLFQVRSSLHIVQRLFFVKYSSDSGQPPPRPVPHTWHWRTRKRLPGLVSVSVKLPGFLYHCFPMSAYPVVRKASQVPLASLPDQVTTPVLLLWVIKPGLCPPAYCCLWMKSQLLLPFLEPCHHQNVIRPPGTESQVKVETQRPRPASCQLENLWLKDRGEPGTASSKEVEGTLAVSKWVAYLWVPETCPAEGSTAHSGPGAELKAKEIEPRCGKTWDSSHLHSRGWFPSRKDTPCLGQSPLYCDSGFSACSLHEPIRLGSLEDSRFLTPLILRHTLLSHHPTATWAVC